MNRFLDIGTASVLITGGGSGIGLGLAARLLAQGANVVVTGRNPEKLDSAARDLPGLRTWSGDLADPQSREALAAHLLEALPELDAVVNNAGIQRRVGLAADHAPWHERQAEIDILLAAPIHLNALLIPRLLARPRPGLIVNVTSGGAYVPQPFAPVYSACKAALHSYTVNLRHALRNTPCRVAELIPPAVQTGLGGSGHGAPLDLYCDTVFPQLFSGTADEVGYGATASDGFIAPTSLYREMFEQMQSRFPVESYR